MVDLETPAKAKDELDKTNDQIRQIRTKMNEPESATTAYSPDKTMSSPTSHPMVGNVPKFGLPRKSINEPPMSASTAYSPVQDMNSPTSQPIIGNVPKFGKPGKPIKAWEDELIPKKVVEY